MLFGHRYSSKCLNFTNGNYMNNGKKTKWFCFWYHFFFSFCDYILSPQRFLQDWSFYRRAVENYRCSIMQWVIRIYLSTNSERPTVRAFTTYKWLKMEKIVLLFKILKPYKGVFPSSNLFCLVQRTKYLVGCIIQKRLLDVIGMEIWYLECHIL